MNSPRFHILAEMTRDVLVFYVSSVASESAFSTGGRILDSFRRSLTPKLVQALVCCQDLLRSDSLLVEKIKKDLDYLKQFELGKNISCIISILVLRIVYFFILHDTHFYFF